MSYDIEFRVKAEGTNEWVDITPNNLINITWNLRDMICASTGLEWKNEENNGLVKDVIPYIRKGYDELTTRPHEYLKYEAPNGWGTVNGCVGFFKDILKAWEDLESYHPELAKVATFWIL